MSDVSHTDNKPLSDSAWHPRRCEVQFDYGLRQRRSRKLELRPVSFLSSGGKVISVNREVAAVNDRITKRGKVWHPLVHLNTIAHIFLSSLFTKPLNGRFTQSRNLSRLLSQRSGGHCGMAYR